MPRSADRGGSLLLPASLGAAGSSLLIDHSPLIAAGLGGVTLLTLIPWTGLLILLMITAIIQSEKLGLLSGVQIAGLHMRLAMLVVIPFALRTYLFTRPEVRNRWKVPEYMLLAFLLLQPITSYLHSPSFKGGLPTIGLIFFGVAAYLAVYAAICSGRRLIVATRAFLWVVMLNAAYGVLAGVSHLALGTSFGVSLSSAYGVGIYALSGEHDIFGSTCAAGAIAFFVLRREPNPVVSRRTANYGFALCLIGMFLGLSRAAWVAFGVAFVAMWLLSRTPRARRRRPRSEWVGIGLMAGAVIGLLAAYLVITTPTSTSVADQSLIGGIKAKFSRLVNFGQGTGKTRLSETRTALSDISTSPLFGLGDATYNMRHPLIKSTKRTNYIGDLWLRDLYDSGIVGLLLFAGAVVIILWPTRDLLRGGGQLAPIARALTFGWFVLVIAYAGTDDTYFVWPWVFLALVRVARLLSRRENLERLRATSASASAPGGRLLRASARSAR